MPGTICSGPGRTVGSACASRAGSGWRASTPRAPARSYAAGHPEEQDLYLVETVEVDPDTGEWVYEDDRPVSRGSGIPIRWGEVEYLEFIEA